MLSHFEFSISILNRYSSIVNTFDYSDLTAIKYLIKHVYLRDDIDEYGEDKLILDNLEE